MVHTPIPHHPAFTITPTHTLFHEYRQCTLDGPAVKGEYERGWHDGYVKAAQRVLECVGPLGLPKLRRVLADDARAALDAVRLTRAEDDTGLYRYAQGQAAALGRAAARAKAYQPPGRRL